MLHCISSTFTFNAAIWWSSSLFCLRSRSISKSSCLIRFNLNKKTKQNKMNDRTWNMWLKIRCQWLYYYLHCWFGIFLICIIEMSILLLLFCFIGQQIHSLIQPHLQMFRYLKENGTTSFNAFTKHRGSEQLETHRTFFNTI